jgi:hypothetical protein
MLNSLIPARLGRGRLTPNNIAALNSKEPVHILLLGSPEQAKTLFLK